MLILERKHLSASYVDVAYDLKYNYKFYFDSMVKYQQVIYILEIY